MGTWDRLNGTLLKVECQDHGQNRSKNEILDGSPGFSDHMATAFQDVLRILFQLPYFHDSKTYIFLNALHFKALNQMHPLIHGSLQLLWTSRLI